MHVVIVGNGIAGITAARTIRKLSDHRITVISSESPYFFSRTALMYVYMGHMRWEDIIPYENWFWEKNKIHLVVDHVTEIDDRKKILQTSSGTSIPYDSLILATGSSSNTLGIPGEDLDGVTGLYSKQDLEYIESKSAHIHQAVIIGGGLIGIELAEMFRSRRIPVTFLIRESGFLNMILPAEESEMINRHIDEHGIDLRLNTEAEILRGDPSGRLRSVITKNKEVIPADFTGITIGVHPNVEWMRKTSLELREGILVDEFLKTNLRDIYAIGDCAELRNPQPGRRAIEPLWYTGRMMGETVAHVVCGHDISYKPEIWYNSAKFLDIEYQVYGDIRPELAPGQATLFWQHPDRKKSIRINFTENGVIGFNLMGIRFRQEVCEHWIRDQTSVDSVLAQLEFAFFDPEFSKSYAKNVRDAYHQLTGRTIHPESKKGYNQVYSFLKQHQKSTA